MNVIEDSTDISPIRHDVPSNGARLAVYEWGDPQSGARPILFTHGTSFHGRCWDQTIKKMEYPHCYAIDLRGHGQSQNAPPPKSIDEFGRDVMNVAAHFGLRDALGVGHSMGAFSTLYAALDAPGTFKALLLIDPILWSPEAYAERAKIAGSIKLEDQPSIKRRAAFDTPGQMAAKLRGKGNYGTFTDAAWRDYQANGLLPDGEGGVRLACTPEYEAAAYLASYFCTPLNDRYGEFNGPVHIIRARDRRPDEESDLFASPTWPDTFKGFKNATDEQWPELSHCIPMEAPARTAAAVQNMLEAIR